MSGGVDSSVAALVLQEQGYEVIGLTITIWPCAEPDSIEAREDICCSPKHVNDARAVCKQLGIPFYVADFEKEFEERIVEPFCAEYRRGRTPSPCIVCNEKVKYELLMRRAATLDAKAVATGHYAAVEREGGRFVIRKADDRAKDQSYFLFSLTQEMLARTIWPLHAFTKDETRRKAKDAGLKVFEKKESQEICFVADNDYVGFLKRRVPEAFTPGEIVTTAGKLVGRHDGVCAFTIGQRKGLGVSLGRPQYVVGIDATANRVVIGDEAELYRKECTASNINWLAFETLASPIEAAVRVRYRAEEKAACIEPLDGGRVRVVFKEPERAVTPGQGAAFYQGDRLIGGGWIDDF